MATDELNRISSQCKTDAEFLAHTEVRRVYWKAMGVESFHHNVDLGWPDESKQTHNDMAWMCMKCKAICCMADDENGPIPLDWEQNQCQIPDAIDGSLPDATEQLRERLATVWNRDMEDALCEATDAMYEGHDGYESYVYETARQRFMILVAVLNSM